MCVLWIPSLSKAMTQIHCFKVTLGAAEPNTENTEAQKRSMDCVVKETPALTSGDSIEGERRLWSLQGALCSPGFSKLRGPVAGLERRGIRLSLPVWVWPSRQIKVPKVLYQRRKPKRTGWVWRKPEK